MRNVAGAVAAAAAFAAFAAGLGGELGCASSGGPVRAYRASVAAPPFAATQRVAHAMERTDTDLRPTSLDASRGVVLARWRVVGASSAVTLLPPGERHWWLLARYRAFVRAGDAGWTTSVVFVDQEDIRCETAGFRMDATNVWGACEPVSEISDAEQAAVDREGAALGATLARP